MFSNSALSTSLEQVEGLDNSLPSCISALGTRSEPVVQQTFYIRVGQGELTKDYCGMITGAASCPSHHDHHKILFRYHCNDPRCPACYEHYCNQAAHRVEDKLQGISKAFHREGVRVGKPRQVVFSPPQQDWPRERVERDGGESLRKEFSRVFKSSTKYYGGTFILHCERKKHTDGTECEDHNCRRKHIWVWGPHIHYVGWGYFKNSALFHKETRWIYKTVDDGGNVRNIFKTVRYLLTHAATFKRGQMLVRYIGMATSGRKQIKEKHKEAVQCRICGEELRRNGVYPDGTVDHTIDQGPYNVIKVETVWIIRTKALAKVRSQIQEREQGWV